MGTVHLTGTFGVVREPIDADFGYFGVTIRVHPDANDLTFVELMDRARGVDLAGLDPDDPSTWDPELVNASQEAGNLAMDAVRQQIHPDDWDLFFATARRNRQLTLDLMALSHQLTAVVAGFPTGRSSGSPAGRPSTTKKSKGGSASPAQRDTTRALRLLRGRPDLQAGVLRAEQARSAG